jgi:hypothetical protein
MHAGGGDIESFREGWRLLLLKKFKQRTFVDLFGCWPQEQHRLNAALPKLRETLESSVLDSYREENKELSETWRSLETKAQGAVAISGIFIAGAFAYIREVNLQGHRVEKIFLGTSILSLVVSVVLSIFALRARKVAAAPIGEYLDELVQDLLQLENDGELEERLPDFVKDQIRLWRIVVKAASATNKSKARYLLAAYVFLVLAILMVALLSILKLVG